MLKGVFHTHRTPRRRCYLPAFHIAALDVVTRHTGKTVCELIVDGIDEHLEDIEQGTKHDVDH